MVGVRVGVGKGSLRVRVMQVIVSSADDAGFNQKSIDKAFGKHTSDFGKYPDSC